jgi:hypothetical protein
MFIATLFIIAKLWKQPWCPTTDEWIKKMWSLCAMEFYSATKKNEILSFANKWMELENSILSKVNQAQKAKHCMFSFIRPYFWYHHWSACLNSAFCRVSICVGIQKEHTVRET